MRRDATRVAGGDQGAAQQEHAFCWPAPASLLWPLPHGEKQSGELWAPPPDAFLNL